MSTSFEQIKDANQLQDYLQKHAAAGGVVGTSNVKPKDASPAANDYMGMKQLKAIPKSRPGNQVNGGQQRQDRYEKRSSRKQGKAFADEDKADDYSECTLEQITDEQRSVHAELDYTKKDATRHIVQRATNSTSLRAKLLRNIEGVRKNKPLLRSEAGSLQQSLRSRISNVSARASAAPQGQFLDRIEEANDDNAKAYCCEICQNDNFSEEDLAVNEEMSKSMPDEENLRNAYNVFRQRKGLAAVDFSTIDPKSPHKIQLCFNCLLDCFQARRVEANDYELDEVSAYRGTLMQGIGIAQNGGRYPRKLGDELGLQRKRPFDKTQNCLSMGFEALAVPCGKETLMIEFAEQRSQQKAIDYKSGQQNLMSSTLQTTQTNNFFSPEDPAGTRMPKPFKKTYTDKLPEWLQQCKRDGMSDAQVQEIMRGKEAKYIGKWGNSSKVGYLINSNENDQHMHEKLQMSPRNQAPQTKQRLSSLPALVEQSYSAAPGRRTKSISVRAKNLSQVRNSQRPRHDGHQTLEHFQTTNQSFHDVLEQQDFSAVKRNFKKKTPFTQWSNAYFSGGVFFNPPTSGL